MKKKDLAFVDTYEKGDILIPIDKLIDEHIVERYKITRINVREIEAFRVEQGPFVMKIDIPRRDEHLFDFEENLKEEYPEYFV